MNAVLDASQFTNCLPVPLAYAPEPIEKDTARLIFRPDPLSLDAAALDLTSGVCLLAAVRESLRNAGYRKMPRGAKIWVSDSPLCPPVEIPRSQWGTFMIRHGMRISVTVKFSGGGGGGSKNPLNTILSLVVVAAAAAATWYVGGTGSFGAISALGLGSTWGSLAGAAVMIGGMLLVNTIAPMSAPKLSLAQNQASYSAEKIWSIDGIKNKADLYGVVPLVLGRVRFAPRYFATPYTYLNGNNQHARYLLGVMGHCKVEKIRSGDTDIEQYKEVRCNVYENWTGEAFEFFPAAIYQEDVGLTLTNASGWHTRTTAQNTKEIQWEVHFNNGLCHIASNGAKSAVKVDFQAEYRPYGTEEWLGAFGNISCQGGTATWTATPPRPTQVLNTPYEMTTSVSARVYTTADGEVSLSAGSQIGTATKIGHWLRTGTTWDLTGISYRASAVSTYSGTISLNKDTITVTPGQFKDSGFSVSRSTLTPVRMGFNVGVPEGQYDFRLKRVTGDHSQNTTTTSTRSEAVWSILKSLRTGPVVKYTGVPYTIIELDIKATEQLHGHLDEINAIFTSYAPVWNSATETWEDAPTNNPASLMLMVATTPVINHPVSMDDMDLTSMRGLYEWCEKHGWAFNSVETSEVYARETTQSILSACRGSFAIKNGKFGCVWDHTDKARGYPYGPRNSWGFKASKTFVQEEIHALRYHFLNEDRDFQEDERLVYADGYNADNATNIVEAEQDGCTNPALIHRHGRLRLADSQWRPETYIFSTDFSHLFVSKGDRIPLTHDVPMWGIRQARSIDVHYADYDLDSMNRAALDSLALENQRLFPQGVDSDGILVPVSEFTAWLATLDDDALRDAIDATGIKDEEWVTAVVIDDYVSMETGKNYAFRYFSSASSSMSFSVETEDGTTNVLKLQVAVPAATAPPHDGLIHFGEAGRETHDCIVTAIETEDNLCAKITCQDYSVEQIYAALTGPIPPWDSDITIPSRWQLGKPHAPVVTGILSDEFALIRTANGTLLPRIQVNFAITERGNITVDSVRVEVREVGSGSGWQVAGTAKPQAGVVYAEGVLEGVAYELRLIAISATGAGSNYSPIYTETVIGRTTPPPPPIRVNVDGNRIWWEMPADAPIDVSGWEVWMGFDAEDDISYAKMLTAPYTPGQEFDLTKWAGWARRVWVRTIDDIGLTSDFVSIAINLGDIIVDNLVDTLLEGDGRRWPGSVTNGRRADVGLVPEAKEPFWQRSNFWQVDKFWQSTDTESMVYTTMLRIEGENVKTFLSVQASLPFGTLASIEYRFVESSLFWARQEFWTSKNFWAIENDSDWQPMPDKLWIDEPRIIELRLTTVAGSPGIVEELTWIFDVEDEVDYADNLEVPAEGVRVPLNKTFRYIKNVQLTLEYIEGGAADVPVWIDKGVIIDGLVTEGPLVCCRDSEGSFVPGIIDVTMQGAKGA